MEAQIKRVEWIAFGAPTTEGVYAVANETIFIPQEAIDTVARQGAPYFGVEITAEPAVSEAQWRVTKLVYDAFDP